MLTCYEAVTRTAKKLAKTKINPLPAEIIASIFEKDPTSIKNWLERAEKSELKRLSKEK